MADSPLTPKRTMETVPDIVIGRLPIYLQALDLMESEGLEVASSKELGQRLGISSAQIRKDLSHFGEFGKQGTGYRISFLKRSLEEILHLDQTWPVALIGLGDLGNAVAHYQGFVRKGFIIKAIFDVDPNKIGTTINDIEVQDAAHLAETIAAEKIRIAVIATPLEAAQEIANLLVKCGVGAILNYAPITLSVSPGVKVQNIDPVAHLQQMTYYLA